IATGLAPALTSTKTASRAIAKAKGLGPKSPVPNVASTVDCDDPQGGPESVGGGTGGPASCIGTAEISVRAQHEPRESAKRSQGALPRKRDDCAGRKDTGPVAIESETSKAVA